MARYIFDGQVYQGDQALIIDDIEYRPGALTAQERGAWGITEVVEEPRPDDTLAFVAPDPAAPGKWISTPFPPERIAQVLDDKKGVMITAVNSKRDDVMAAGATFNGKLFQTRDDDIANINGAATLAFMAVVAGVKAGDLRWHGGTSDFSWIADDNAEVKMDAQTVIAFGRAVAAHKTACIFYARSIKNTILAVTSLDALNKLNIDLSAGWPAP